MIPISQIGFSCQPRLTVFGAHEVPCSSLFRFPKHQATKWEDTQKILALESFISRAVDISVDYLFFSFSYASVIYIVCFILNATLVPDAPTSLRQSSPTPQKCM